MPGSQLDNPFRAIKAAWIGKAKVALDYKREHFQSDADEAMRFFNGPYDFMYGLQYRKGSSAYVFTGNDDLPRPSFAMTVNKVAEMVQLFGPVLYHRNPIRQANPRKYPMVPVELFGDPNDPMVQQQFIPIFQEVQKGRSIDIARSQLIECMLNYTPAALDLKTEARNWVDEALIKGMAVLWHEVYQPAGASFKMFGSFFDTIDNLLVDPDFESISAAKYIMRRFVRPVWEVERAYGYQPGSLRGSLESYSAQATVSTGDSDAEYLRKQGLTNDLLVYWKVFSKMGMGNRLQGMPKDILGDLPNPNLDRFGDYCILDVCESLEHPLNLPPEIWDNDEEIMKRIQWETPFWADDAWPCTTLGFHWIPRKVYPMSHVKPGLGELKFINWAYSFLAGKVRSSCRDFIAIAKSAGEELKTAILRGTDYELIEIEKAHGTISEIVQFLQHPNFQGDIYKVIEAVTINFEKRVGLTELMYGASATQLRSATEAQVKGTQMQVRPDDMANKVEDAMSEVARKEAFGLRWHLDPQDVLPVLGPVGAYFWSQIVTPADPNELLHSLEFRVEAGSARKPNKDRDAANMQQAMQNILPVLQGYMMATGDPSAVNALLQDWAKSIDLDGANYILKPPPPPPPPVAGPPAKGKASANGQAPPPAQAPAPAQGLQAQIGPGGGPGGPPGPPGAPNQNPQEPAADQSVLPAGQPGANGQPGGMQVPSVYLVRHGSTQLNDEGANDKIRGWANIPLDDRGIQEGRLTAEYLLNQQATDGQFAVIHTSDLQRAVQTAQIISDVLGGTQVVPNPAFRPWNLGQFQGQSSAKVHPQIMQFAKMNPDQPVPGGESFNDFKNRYLGGLIEILQGVMQDPSSGPCVVVGHYRTLKLTEAWLSLNPQIDPNGPMSMELFNRNDLPMGTLLNLEFDPSKGWEFEVIKVPMDSVSKAGQMVQT